MNASKLSVVAVSFGLFAMMSQTAVAQNPSANPTYGSVTLRAGFTPDPFVRQVTAGGTNRTNLGGVNAFVAASPDFRLFYTKGSLPLTIRVESTADTTLLINLPNGQWIANDDGGGGLNPAITLPAPMSGRYDIFVGTFGPNVAPARLIITELGNGPAPTPTPTPIPLPNPIPTPNPIPMPTPSTGPNPGMNPTYGAVNLRAGFLPDPFVRQVTAGGTIRTNLGGVNAFVAMAPDFRLNYTKGFQRLTIRVESTADTTLLINLPDGRWIANDDARGLNPALTFTAPMSGRYDIYVGTFGQTPTPARLIITERE